VPVDNFRTNACVFSLLPVPNHFRPETTQLLLSSAASVRSREQKGTLTPFKANLGHFM
jgi:hypothetical protein